MNLSVFNLFLFIFFALKDYSEFLRLTDLNIPDAVLIGESVWLNCSYDLENDTLYSIKWYRTSFFDKDDEQKKDEFYRYLPNETPSIQIYNSTGMYIDHKKSNFGCVYLWKTDLSTEGRFRCEVSADAPFFQTFIKEAEMHVYYLPKSGPTLYSFESNPIQGNNINLTCHVGPSKPKSKLTWYINDIIAPSQFVHNLDKKSFNEKKLQSTISQLQFSWKEKFFDLHKLKIKCKAELVQNLSDYSLAIIVWDQKKLYSKFSVIYKGHYPKISGLKSSYDLGDKLNLTCTSSKSKLKQRIDFYVNDQLYNLSFNYSQIKYSNGIQISQKDLELVLTHDVFTSLNQIKSKPRWFNKDYKHIQIRCTSELVKVIEIGSVETVIESNYLLSGRFADESIVASSSVSNQGLKIKDEIIRIIQVFILKLDLENIQDDLKLQINCEINKANLLLKGKLKMFNNLCLISLKELDPIEYNKEVNVSDLEGYYNLLKIEMNKIRKSFELITNKNNSNKNDDDEKENQLVLKKERPIKSIKKAQIKSITERNQRYMERMKKLKEKNH